ncbi:MAG TPA: hypothetical protein VKT29_05545 [Terriglobales bacterium]|nr:hypothetical protein [Terriglobales bacterium]
MHRSHHQLRFLTLLSSFCLLAALFGLAGQPVLGKFDLQLSNEIVQVFSLDLPAGSHVRLRQNIYDVIVIALEDSTLTLVPAEGAGNDLQLNSGDVRILPKLTVNELANNTAVKSRFVIVALKSHGIETGECGCSGEVEKSICGCTARHLPRLWAFSIGGSTLAGVSLNAGQDFAGASYREDSLLVALTPLRLLDERASGPESLLSLAPGEAKWLPQGQRQFKNVGSTAARFITIEF